MHTDTVLEEVFNDFVHNVNKRTDGSVEVIHSYIYQLYQFQHFLEYIGYEITYDKKGNNCMHFVTSVEGRELFMSLKDALFLYEYCGTGVSIEDVAYKNNVTPAQVHSYEPFKKVKKLKLARHPKFRLTVLNSSLVSFCEPIKNKDK